MLGMQYFMSFHFFRYRGTYCGQEVAIKILKPGRANAAILRDFAQEIYIMRFVLIYFLLH